MEMRSDVIRFGPEWARERTRLTDGGVFGGVLGQSGVGEQTGRVVQDGVDAWSWKKCKSEVVMVGKPPLPKTLTHRTIVATAA